MQGDQEKPSHYLIFLVSVCLLDDEFDKIAINLYNFVELTLSSFVTIKVLP